MMYRQFKLMLKHFRVCKPLDMPEKNSPNYHSLQKYTLRSGLHKKKSSSLWVPGRRLCLNEGRIVSKSKRNVYITRNPGKPIRMGWTVDKLADKRALEGYYVHNNLTKVGKHSYTDTSKCKNYNIVDQLQQRSRVWEKPLLWKMVCQH